jgi:hypothetical protein
MNRNTFSGSLAVETACPNRDQNLLFRHSKTARVNLRPWPQEAAEELCTFPSLIRAVPPLLFLIVIFICCSNPLSVTPIGKSCQDLQPGVHREQTFPAVSTPSPLRWASSYVIADSLNSSPYFTPDFLRFFEIFDFRFQHQIPMKNEAHSSQN